MPNIIRYGLSIAFLLFSYSASAAPSCKILFSEPAALIQGESEVIKYISENLNEAKTDAVVERFIQLFEKSVLSDDNRVMSEAQFFTIYKNLKQIASEYGIRIESKVDTMGIFPAGLDLIRIAGFSEPTATTSGRNVNFAKRHELAHLFHVIALRSIVLENANYLKDLNKQQLKDYVEAIESGNNYLEFEKIVTDISGALHVLSPLKSGNERYGEKLRVLLNGLKPALLSGKVKFKNGWGVLEVYAKFVSKAPLVLGKSFAGLAVRLPFIYFATQFMMDEAFRGWVAQVLALY